MVCYWVYHISGDGSTSRNWGDLKPIGSNRRCWEPLGQIHIQTIKIPTVDALTWLELKRLLLEMLGMTPTMDGYGSFLGFLDILPNSQFLYHSRTTKISPHWLANTWIFLAAALLDSLRLGASRLRCRIGTVRQMQLAGGFNSCGFLGNTENLMGKKIGHHLDTIQE